MVDDLLKKFTSCHYFFIQALIHKSMVIILQISNDVNLRLLTWRSLHSNREYLQFLCIHHFGVLHEFKQYYNSFIINICREKTKFRKALFPNWIGVGVYRDYCNACILKRSIYRFVIQPSSESHGNEYQHLSKVFTAQVLYKFSNNFQHSIIPLWWIYLSFFIMTTDFESSSTTYCT